MDKPYRCLNCDQMVSVTEYKTGECPHCGEMFTGVRWEKTNAEHIDDKKDELLYAGTKHLFFVFIFLGGLTMIVGVFFALGASDAGLLAVTAGLQMIIGGLFLIAVSRLAQIFIDHVNRVSDIRWLIASSTQASDMSPG